MKKIPILTLALLIFLTFPAASKDAPDPSIVRVNSPFIRSLKRTSPIERDRILARTKDKIIQATGTVIAIDKKPRYRNTYRVSLIDREAKSQGLSVTYYLFIKDKNSIDLLVTGAVLEFWGQLMAVTPVSTKRTSYILDVVYERGSVLID